MSAVSLRGFQLRTPGGFTPVDLDLPSGSLTVICGPAGSGAEDLVRHLAAPEAGSGSTRIHGRPPGRDGRQVALANGQVFLIPYLTVAENAALHMRGAGSYDRGVTAAMARFGLSDLADRYPEQLTTAGIDLVSVVAAVLGQPALVVVDVAIADGPLVVPGPSTSDSEAHRFWRALHDAAHLDGRTFVAHRQTEGGPGADSERIRSDVCVVVGAEGVRTIVSQPVRPR